MLLLSKCVEYFEGLDAPSQGSTTLSISRMADLLDPRKLLVGVQSSVGWSLLRSAMGSALTVVACLAPDEAAAQVNTEALRPRIMQEGFSGNADISLGIAKGNVDFVDFGGGARFQLQSLRPPRPEGGLRFAAQRFFVAANARYAERTGQNDDTPRPFVNQTFVHARWTGMWRERFGTEIFAQVQTNEFLRLRVRMLGGTGVRFEIVHEEPIQVWIGTGTMLEYNRIDVASGALDPPTEVSHRSTSYVGIRSALREKSLLFQGIAYLQPTWKTPSDLRALFELEALVKLTEAFSLGNTLSVLHDTRPPTGVRPTDLRLTTSLELAF